MTQRSAESEAPSRSLTLKITLVFAAALTVMSAEVISPALPDIQEHFADAGGPVVSAISNWLGALGGQNDGQGGGNELVVKLLLTLRRCSWRWPRR